MLNYNHWSDVECLSHEMFKVSSSLVLTRVQTCAKVLNSLCRWLLRKFIPDLLRYFSKFCNTTLLQWSSDHNLDPNSYLTAGQFLPSAFLWQLSVDVLVLSDETDQLTRVFVLVEETGGLVGELEMTPVSAAIARHLNIDLSQDGLAARNRRGIALIVYGAPMSGNWLTAVWQSYLIQIVIFYIFPTF